MFGIDVLAAFRQPLEMLTDTSERVYWLYLASAALLALVVMGPRRGWAALRSGLFATRLWTHPSARTDLLLLFAKAIVAAMIGIPWAAATIASTLWFGLALYDVLGPAPELGWSPFAIGIVYTVVLFVAWDLSRFVLHWLTHVVPWLWAFHQVHHSAEVLNPLTLHRTHPVETVLYDLRGWFVTTVVAGTFLYLFRGTAIELELLGINAFGCLFNVLGANLRHSQVWLSFGPLERWLLSPAQHQLHHGRTFAEQNCNYGTWLSIWDRWLGSFRPSPAEPLTVFGLEGGNHRPDSVLSILIGPFRELAEPLVRRVSPRAGLLGGLVVLLGLVPRQAHAQAPTTPPQTVVDPAPPAEPSMPAQEPTDPAPTQDAAPPIEGSAPPPSDGEATPPVTDDAASPGEPAGSDVATAPDEATATDDDEVIELPPEPTPEPTTASPETAAKGEAPPADAPIELETITVTASRVPGSAQVVDDRALARKEYDDVHRVLSQVPGVYVREEDGFGLRPNIGIRGANSDRSAKITLMEDGILLAPAPYSAPAAYYFPLMTRMTSVNVWKGPAAIPYGPHTIGGAIDLRTRAIPSRMRGYLDAAAGMRGYGKLHGFWGTSTKRFGILLEGVHVQSNGFKHIDGGGDTGFNRTDLMLKARYHSDPNRRVYHQLDLKAGYGREQSDETYLGLSKADFAADPYRRYAGSRDNRMKWWRSQAQLEYFVARGTLVDFQAVLYRHDFHRAWRKFNRFRAPIDILDVLANPEAGQNQVFYGILTGTEDALDPSQALLVGTNDRRFVSEGLHTVTHIRPVWRWLEQDIEIGARIHHDQIRRLHTEDGYLMTSGVLVPEGTETDVIVRNRGQAIAGAFYLVDTIRIKQLTLVPGARVEVIHTRFEDRTNEPARRDNTTTVFVPGLGVHLQALPWLGLLAGVHRGFSPVSPEQPKGTQPERSTNYEAGARVLHHTRRTNTRVDAIGFFNDYANLTGVCTLSSGCNEEQLDRQFDGGRAFVYGLEFSAAERIGFKRRLWLEIGGSYTYTGSRFRTSFDSSYPLFGAVERGDSLPYVPEHLAAMNLETGGRTWGLGVTGSYVGVMRDVAGQGAIASRERVPAHFVADFDAHISVTKRASLYLTLNNFTNSKYIVSLRPYGARPGMPLQLMVGFKYDFIRS